MRRRQVIMWIALGLALGAVLEFLPKPHHNVFWGVTYNTGHAPLFGVGAIVLLQLSRLVLGERVGPYYRHYAVALFGCGALGFASELWQLFDPARDADLWDLARDLLGAAVFLSFAATCDARRRTELPFAARHPRAIRAVAIVALAANFVPVALVEKAYRHRAAEYPALARFESYWDTYFYAAHHGATSERVRPPDGWTGHDGSRALAVTFRGDAGPRLEIVEPEPDWRGHARLVVDIYSAHDETVPLVVRVRDRVFHDNPANRYERVFSIPPGPTRLRIDLDEIRAGPTERTLNMATIRSINFLLDDPPRPVQLYFDNLRLE